MISRVESQKYSLEYLKELQTLLKKSALVDDLKISTRIKEKVSLIQLITHAFIHDSRVIVPIKIS